MDDSQALQGLLELMMNLGALETDCKAELTDADADLEISNDGSIQNSIQTRSELSNTLLVDAENISETIIDVEILTIDRSSQNIPSNISNLEPTSDLVTSNPAELKTSPKTSDKSPNDSNEGAIASLQSLLFGSDLQILRGSVRELDRKVQDIEHHIYDSEELIQLLLPVITDILGIKVSQASAEITQAIAPVIDEMIAVNIQQDQVQMSSALAPVMSTAIIENISISPGEFANAIAPEMGMAIQEQLRLNKDVMIDALYPIIGNTIAKYFAEAIKAINEKVEQTFSKEGILRKIRARMQGISEAELILKESMPVTICAIFLIHKASGLIISEFQNPDTTQILESEMVAGMLTAIRSFVNDCISQSGFDTELSEIDYGGSKILLEAAGCCYMAVVMDGVTAKPLISKIRNTLEAIVQTHSKSIENFDGDLDTVPSEITPALEQIFIKEETGKAQKKPNTLLVLLIVLIGAIAIPWSIFSYQQHQNQQKLAQIKSQVTQALFSAPELSVYGIAVNVIKNQDRNQIQLQGRVPNPYLKDLATKIALGAATKSVDESGNKSINQSLTNESITINNQIIAVNIPPDPSQTIAEVERVTNLLNKLNGIKIAATYNLDKNSNKNQVAIAGTVQKFEDRKTVIAAFAQIPRVAIVTSNIQVLPPLITTRIYFDFNSTAVAKTEIPKILQIKLIVDLDPNYQLKIIGHSDRLGDLETNRRIALKRAQVVRNLLTQAGLSETRSQAMGAELLPTASDRILGRISQPIESSPELERYVQFEVTVANLGNLNSLGMK